MARGMIGMAAAIAASASTAAAQSGRLYVSGPTGTVLTAGAGGGDFRFLGVCAAPVQSMVRNGRELLLGDTAGTVYRLDLATEQFVGSFSVGQPATAMVMHNGALIVGSETGPIRRIDPQTGQVLSTFTAPAGGVHAMAVSGTTLFTGSHSTIVSKGSVLTGGFSFLTVCGGAVDAAAVSNGELVLGTTGTTVYRINPGNGAYYGTFQMDRPQVAIVPAGGATIVVAHGDGLVRTVNQPTGAVLSSRQAPVQLKTMVIDSCPADVNADGTLTIADFGAFQTAFVANDMRMDFNNDGFLTLADFGAYQTAFVAGCP